MHSVESLIKSRHSVGSESDAIQSEASATQLEETDETDQEQENERKQRSRIYSFQRPLRRHHSVGSECDSEEPDETRHGRRFSVEEKEKKRDEATIQSRLSATQSEESDKSKVSPFGDIIVDVVVGIRSRIGVPFVVLAARSNKQLWHGISRLFIGEHTIITSTND
jgi:hypothetical protein